MPPPGWTLDSLRRELLRIDEELLTGENRERDMLFEMDHAQRRIVLLDQAVREQRQLGQELQDSIKILETEISARERELGALGGQIMEIEDDERALAESVARAMLARKRLTNWAMLEFLVGAYSWRELLVRRSVISRMETVGRRAVESLSGLRDSLQIKEDTLFLWNQELRTRRDRLAGSRAVVAALEADVGKDLSSLTENKTLLQKRLNRVRQNRRLLSAQRDELAEAQKQIEEIVNRIARGEPLAGVPLTLLKGSLPWPVDGRVVQRFGTVRNRDLATLTDNPGIDIEAGAETEVASVADGRVSSVTWLRGYGNVCIVEHPASFYTVYAKLGQVNVQAGDEVAMMEPIGYPGWDIATESYRVHFELWSGKTKKNPLEWLKKR
ncbi:peptidoglycan DD-metalloendopeptidase family protein [bacterium]|nr:peptidoglycan DD-metalloendopeptidase family protein [bacterium]